MGDIRIVFDPGTRTGDFSMSGPSLELGDDLETAVLISIFTDASADPSDLLPDAQRNDPRGWWANTYEAPDNIGSKLWQVFFRQTTPDTLNWARDEVTKALQWMIDDGVATSVTVDTQFIGKGALAFRAVIVEPAGKKSVFSYAWGIPRGQAEYAVRSIATWDTSTFDSEAIWT